MIVFQRSKRKRRKINETVGLVQSEFTPMDLMALLDDLAINQIVTSKVEVGIQQKSYL